jgi:hypothetical protein
MCVPCEVRPSSGRSQTRTLCARPKDVKNRRCAWAVATKIWSTMSSPLRPAPVTPLPPRPWARYSVSGWRLT